MLEDVWELGALLREASSIFSERFSGFLYAFAEVATVAGVDVGPFEISLEHPDLVSPVVD